MKMDDYRHAADRVHIAEHCRQEVMNMTKNTEPKTRTPIIRRATGIAAAAAVLGITGGFGFMLHSMKNDIQQDPAAQIAEQSSVNYTTYFREYYEARAGHPVNFDFSALCGTDLDKTWEFESGTVHLVAAISDGWTLNCLYTVAPKYEWELTDTCINQLPTLQITSDGIAGSAGCAASSVCSGGLISTALRDDGTLLCLDTVRIDDPAMPLSGDVKYYVNCYDGRLGYHEGNTDNPVSFNLPAQRAECKPLAVPADAVKAEIGLEGQTASYTHSVVTPLGVLLTNYDEAEMAALLREAHAEGVGLGGGGATVKQDAFTVMKAVSGASDPEPVAVTYGDFSKQICAVGDYAMYSTDRFDTDDEKYPAELHSLWLPFTEPQQLDDVMFLQLYTPESLAENEIAACAEVNMQAEGEGKPVPVGVASDDREFPLYDAMTGAQRAVSFDWGEIILLDMAMTEDGEQMEYHIRVNVNQDAEIGGGDSIKAVLKGYMYDDSMQHMLDCGDKLEVTEMQNTDPYSNVYRIRFPKPVTGEVTACVLGDDGNYYEQEWDDFLEKQPMADYLLYGVEFERLTIEDADGAEKAVLIDQKTMPVKARLKDLPAEDDEPVDVEVLYDPMNPYPAIDEQTPTQAMREFGFGSIDVDGYSTDQNGNPMIDITVYPNGAFDAVEGQVLAVRFTAVGFEEGAGYKHYEMHYDECQQGAKWYYTDLRYTDGSYHMHLGLDPRCCSYSENENGEFVTDEESVTVDWTKLNIDLYLNAVMVKNGPLGALTEDGGTFADENTYEYWVDSSEMAQPWQIRFGSAAAKE